MWNTTHENATTTNETAFISSIPASTQTPLHLGLYANHRRFLFSGILLVVGVIGNFLALLILARKKTAKNSKYTLMLRCLATNNLVGLLGMLTTIMLKVSIPKEVYISYTRWDCVGKVIFRFFGLSSGCIAAVMAIERWMALARPFIYHKHITYTLVRRTIRWLVLLATIITFLPFIGFGAYIDDSDPDKLQCLRYRDGEGALNKAYSILFMLFGSILCVVIVACNLFVTRVLCFIGHNRSSTRHMHYDLVNRERGGNAAGNGHGAGASRIDAESNSGSSLYQNQHHHSNSVTMSANTSPDEIKFAKLMTFLSFSFVICWMPQMIAIPMAIVPSRVPKDHPFFMVADILMALHFTSDPYVYVLSRTKHSYIVGCIKRWRCGLKRSQSDQSRLRTTMEQTTDCGIIN